jgi:hypothetical protein
MDGIDSRMERAEKRVSEVEDRKIDIIQSEQRETLKKIKTRKQQKPQNLRNNVTTSKDLGFVSLES